VTKILVNIGNPELAFQLSALPNDGVGLARMEFIISEYIKAHPMVLLHPERVTDPTERAEDEWVGGRSGQCRGRAVFRECKV
jgi:pyruvate,water dikinase